MTAVQHEADVLIIGGGIVGVSLAARLAPHTRCVLVETEHAVAAHSSSRSARQMQPSHGPAFIRSLTARSIAMLREIERCGGPTFLRARQLGWLARASGLAHLETIRREHPELSAVSAPDIPDVLPLVKGGVFARAAIDREAYEVDVPALVDHNLDLANAQGATILTDHRVVESKRAGGEWIVRTTADTVSARVVINAAGAWADDVATLFGAAPRGLRSYLRTVVVTDAGLDSPLRDAPMISDIEGVFYARPDGGSLLVSPSDETPAEPGDARPDPRVVDDVLAVARRILAVPLGETERAWAGLRVFSPDHLPVVGWEDGIPDFYWLAGVGGYGIQTSPALATDVAAEVRDRLSDSRQAVGGKKDAAERSRHEG